MPNQNFKSCLDVPRHFNPYIRLTQRHTTQKHTIKFGGAKAPSYIYDMEKTITQLKDEIISNQKEMIDTLKQIIDGKQKYIEVLERSLDIQDNHIAKQNEMVEDLKKLLKTSIQAI